MPYFQGKYETLCERVLPDRGHVIRAKEVHFVACLGDLIVNESHDAAHAAGTSTGNLMSYEDPHVRLIVTRKRSVLGKAISQSACSGAVRVDRKGRR